jgi:hypothetical protein
MDAIKFNASDGIVSFYSLFCRRKSSRNASAAELKHPYNFSLHFKATPPRVMMAYSNSSLAFFMLEAYGGYSVYPHRFPCLTCI